MRVYDLSNNVDPRSIEVFAELLCILAARKPEDQRASNISFLMFSDVDVQSYEFHFGFRLSRWIPLYRPELRFSS